MCTELRLGWVHRVHTPNPGCAPTARLAGCVVAHYGRIVVHRGRIVAPLSVVSRLCTTLSWSCRWAHPRAGTPCRNSLWSRYKKLYRNPSPCRALCRARCCACRNAPAPCRRVLGAVSQPLAHCVATPSLLLLTHLPAQAVSRPKRSPPTTIQYLYRDSTL